MPSIDDLKDHLKKQLANGISPCMKALKEVLSDQSTVFNDLILMESRLNEANKQRLRGELDDEELQVQYNKIRKGLILLIDEISSSDLKQDENPSSNTESNTQKKGSILYRIPNQMLLDAEEKCMVRIGFEAEDLVAHIELDKHVEVKSIRIAEVMQVEMMDPNANPSFSIRTISSKEQVLQEDAYAEWIFYVKALVAGTLPLVLKVAVIEEIRGKERKREIVLEEQINILTEQVEKPSEELAFKKASYPIAMGAGGMFMPEIPDQPIKTDFENTGKISDLDDYGDEDWEEAEAEPEPEPEPELQPNNPKHSPPKKNRVKSKDSDRPKFDKIDNDINIDSDFGVDESVKESDSGLEPSTLGDSKHQEDLEKRTQNWNHQHQSYDPDREKSFQDYLKRIEDLKRASEKPIDGKLAQKKETVGKRADKNPVETNEGTETDTPHIRPFRRYITVAASVLLMVSAFWFLRPIDNEVHGGDDPLSGRDSTVIDSSIGDSPQLTKPNEGADSLILENDSLPDPIN